MKINSGFGAEGTKYRRFCAEDCRTEVNKELFGLKKTVERGSTESSELIETHWMNLSRVEAESTEETE